jgi:hypothetical protein
VTSTCSSRLCDTKLDALLDEAGRTLDAERRRAIYAEVLTTLNERVVAIWLYDHGRYEAHRARAGLRAHRLRRRDVEHRGVVAPLARLRSDIHQVHSERGTAGHC